jgi:hypothetical protein
MKQRTLILIVLLACGSIGCSSDQEEPGGGNTGGQATGGGAGAGTSGTGASGGNAGTTGSGGGSSGTGGSGMAAVHCVADLPSDPSSCTCTLGSEPPEQSVATCSAASVNGLCCEESGFPNSGLCTCVQWSCEEGESGPCNCGNDVDGSASRCQKEWVECCARTVGPVTTCYCDVVPGCADDWMPVDNCDLAEIGCGDGESKVPACKN